MSSTAAMPAASSSLAFWPCSKPLQQPDAVETRIGPTTTFPSHEQSFSNDSPWPQHGLISTQPDQSASDMASAKYVEPSVHRHNPNVVQMDGKHKELAAHQVTILPTDGAAACLEKLHHVGELLNSGLCSP
jgi:hypothetical protein